MSIGEETSNSEKQDRSDNFLQGKAKKKRIWSCV